MDDNEPLISHPDSENAGLSSHDTLLSTGVDSQNQEEPDKNVSSSLRGLMWCLVFGVARGGMFASQKITSHHYSAQAIDMLLVRSIVIVLGSYLHAKVAGQDLSYFGFRLFNKLSAEAKKIIMWQFIYGYGCFIAINVSIMLMPVSVSVAITMSTVFITVTLGWLLADESMCL